MIVLNCKGTLGERLCISTLVAYLSRMATVLKISREVVAEVRDVSQVGSLGVPQRSGFKIVDPDGFEEILPAQRQTSLEAYS